MFFACPIIWTYKLQTCISLYSFEIEYYPLSQALRESIPFMELLKKINNNIFWDKYILGEVCCKAFGRIKEPYTWQPYTRVAQVPIKSIINIIISGIMFQINSSPYTPYQPRNNQLTYLTNLYITTPFIYLRRKYIHW